MIEELKRLNEQATSGPWGAFGGSIFTTAEVEDAVRDGEIVAVATTGFVTLHEGYWKDGLIGTPIPNRGPDAALIASARNALPILLEIAEAAKDLVAGGGRPISERLAPLILALAKLDQT